MHELIHLNLCPYNQYKLFLFHFSFFISHFSALLKIWLCQLVIDIKLLLFSQTGLTPNTKNTGSGNPPTNHSCYWLTAAYQEFADAKWDVWLFKSTVHLLLFMDKTQFDIFNHLCRLDLYFEISDVARRSWLPFFLELHYVEDVLKFK